MSNKLDLPVEKIVSLVDSGMSYAEVKEELNLDCHKATIGRRYRKFKAELKEKAPELEKMDNYSEELEGVTDASPEEYSGIEKGLGMGGISHSEILMNDPYEKENSGLWQRIINWFRGLFN